MAKLTIAGPGDIIDQMFPPPKGWVFPGGAFTPMVHDTAPYYADDNGVVWDVEWADRGDGWTSMKARPRDAAASYGVKAGSYPVTGVVATAKGVQNAEQWAKNLEFAGEAIADYVAEKKKPSKGGSSAGTLLLILLGLYIVGSDKRRYVGARDEQWF